MGRRATLNPAPSGCSRAASRLQAEVLLPEGGGFFDVFGGDDDVVELLYLQGSFTSV